MTAISLGNGVRRTAAQFPAALLDPRGGGFQGKSYEYVLVIAAGDTGQGPDLGIRQLAPGKGLSNSGQGLQCMRDADFFPRGAKTQIATPVQPLGTVGETPLQPSPPEMLQVAGRSVRTDIY